MVPAALGFAVEADGVAWERTGRRLGSMGSGAAGGADLAGDDRGVHHVSWEGIQEIDVDLSLSHAAGTAPSWSGAALPQRRATPRTLL